VKKFLTTLAALTVIASPAFAQSFDPEAGTGNVLPTDGGSAFVQAAPKTSIARHMLNAAKSTHQMSASGVYGRSGRS